MTECNSLAEVRSHIDRLDSRIVPLLAERAGYVAQAARFKETKAKVVDVERIEEIVRRVRHLAVENAAQPDLIEHIYRAMMDAYIVFESQVWKDVHKG
ncbi:MAG: chorismate mutase [Actinomycetota bacterium]